MAVEEIIIARHAEALDKMIARREGLLDSQRPLTKKGMKIQEEVLKQNKSWLKGAQLLIHSSLVRAQETSRIILRNKKIPQTLEFKSMAPNDDPTKLQQFLMKLNIKKVILVGHDPHLTQFLKLLVSDSGDFEVKLKKSSLCYLKWNAAEQKFTIWGLFNPQS